MHRIISGLPCSGTTLLVDLLGTHSKLSPIYETDFVGEWVHMLYDTQPHHADELVEFMDTWSENLPNHPNNKKDYERYVHGPHHILFDQEAAMERARMMHEEMMSGGDIEESMVEAVTDLFDQHKAIDGKRHWVNKVPMYLGMLPHLRELFPDIKVINCVRHPYDFTESVLDRPFGPESKEESAEFWNHLVHKGFEFGLKYPSQYIQVRYEDMINYTEEVVEDSLEFFGLEQEPLIENYPYEIYKKRMGIGDEVPGIDRELMERLDYGN